MKLLIILSLFLITACATTGSKKNTAKKYSKSMYALSLKNSNKILSSANCPRTKRAWQNKKWKEIVNMTNSCVSLRKWSTVGALANHLAKTEAQSPWGPYFLSLKAESDRNYQKSLWMINLSLKKSPNVGILNYQKGRVLWKLGQHGAAIAQIELAISENLRLLDAHLFLGKVFLRDLDLGKASSHLNLALKASPNNRRAMLGLAEVYRLKNEGATRVKLLTKAAAIYPKDVDVRLGLARALEEVEGDHEKALHNYLQAKKYVRSNNKLKMSLQAKIKSLKVTISKNRQSANRQPASVTRN